ncbi:MAG TPA: tRNA lysidine(34) synthetase TilS [Acetobacteraceae bacterium]|nr:tRNA lysidine(34) synthetase TilS [Acetobacteraceae bacterium]
MPRLAAGVSGGPDSMALALLADAWARALGGSLLAFIVDHGLREASATEAAESAARLMRRSIPARVLTIRGLVLGPALAERARAARLRALTEACAAEGILHLLLGHHALDQAETVLIRTLGGSGPAGLAGIAALVETTSVRILRPLLGVPPEQLRATLTAAAMEWIEDPSNVDATALRPRLRLARRDRGGHGSATVALAAAAAAAARQRADADRKAAWCLADRAELHPEGYCLLSGCSPGAEPGIDPRALAALLQAISGAPFPPPTASVASLAAQPRPATLAGVRLMAAGRLGQGLLVLREAAAMAPPVAAVPGAVWDSRFRLQADALVPTGGVLGALGADAARLRHASPLPAAVLRTLPVVRLDGQLLAVPHLMYPDTQSCERIPLVFSPPIPAAAAPFLGL